MQKFGSNLSLNRFLQGVENSSVQYLIARTCTEVGLNYVVVIFFYKTYFSLSFSFKCDIFHVCLNMEIGMSYLMRNQPKFFFNQETETYIKRYEASNNGYRSRRMYRGAVNLILFRHCPSKNF